MNAPLAPLRYEATFGPQDVEAVAHAVLAHSPTRCVALQGDLGAGKTTLVQAACRWLGVTQPVHSPTFTLANEYAGAEGPVYHLDCYRLRSVSEALEAGLADYFHHPGAWTFVEWWEVIATLLPPGATYVRLEHVSETQRHITIARDIT